MELEGPRSAIAAQLIDLEAALRQLDLWSDESPSQEALSSEQPFAMDSLEFEEWLQFIFLPTLYEVLASGGALQSGARLRPWQRRQSARRGYQPSHLSRRCVSWTN